MQNWNAGSHVRVLRNPERSVFQMPSLACFDCVALPYFPCPNCGVAVAPLYTPSNASNVDDADISKVCAVIHCVSIMRELT